MFKNEFQGGPFVEVFNPSSKEPLSACRVTGPHGVQKLFDRDVRGSIYQLDGTPATTKIAMPKDSKQGCKHTLQSNMNHCISPSLSLLLNECVFCVTSIVSLIQRFLVVQVYVNVNHEFSMEIGYTNTTHKLAYN